MPDQHDDSLSKYLSDLRARSGVSLDYLAKETGYKGRSSVQRYFEDTKLRVLPLPIARKFAKVFYNRGNPPIKILDLVRLLFEETESMDMGLKSYAALLELDHDENLRNEPSEESVGDMIPVVEASQRGIWFEQDRLNDPPKDYLDIPFKTATSFWDEYAVLIKDDSINNVAPAGTYAICRKVKYKDTNFPNSRFFHVRRKKSGLIENSVLQLIRDDNGIRLKTDSRGSALNETLDWQADENIMEIVGIVVGWYRPA